jgi:hypothetical protein
MMATIRNKMAHRSIEAPPSSRTVKAVRRRKHVILNGEIGATIESLTLQTDDTRVSRASTKLHHAAAENK